MLCVLTMTDVYQNVYGLEALGKDLWFCELKSVTLGSIFAKATYIQNVETPVFDVCNIMNGCSHIYL